MFVVKQKQVSRDAEYDPAIAIACLRISPRPFGMETARRRGGCLQALQYGRL